MAAPTDRASAAALGADEWSLARAGAPDTHPDFDRLARTIWRLRQEDGCPWDRAQTHRSIRNNMIEEAYEAVDAIDADDVPHIREELGDVMMQVLLHAQIADDGGEFDIDDVCRDLNEKLVRRHPHVFGDLAGADDPDSVLAVWDDVKRDERAAASAADDRPHGLMDSVPRAMPSLMQAQKISKRAARAGFEWETVEDVWDKVDEERAEFLAEGHGSPEAAVEFGDLLFALVNVARHEGIDAEAALDAANAKFRRRWSAMEAEARGRGVELDDLGIDELNAMWNRAKASEGLG